MRYNKKANNLVSDDIVFSLEKIPPTPTPTATPVPPTPTPTEVTCDGSPFSSSITTVLGANSEVPEFYYGESFGVSIVSVAQLTIQYQDLNNSFPAFTMDIQIGGEPVATVNAWTGYLNNNFEVEYLGVKYCGQFALETVNLS